MLTTALDVFEIITFDNEEDHYFVFVAAYFVRFQ